MKILIIGASGQLGYDLKKVFKDDKKVTLFLPSSEEINVTNDTLQKIIEIDFDLLINCSSYHKVDEVEDNPDKAFKVNAFAIKSLSQICEEKNKPIITISTDYVFGGSIHNKKIDEDESTDPLNVYGSSKALGENFAFQYHSNPMIIRVASLFGTAGSKEKQGNFVDTIVKLSRKKGKLDVVQNQIMSPTSTSFIASTIYSMVKKDIFTGVYNIVCEGEVSWYEFACKIRDLTGIKCQINPINSSALDQRALRPSYSALSANKIKEIGISVPDYRDELEQYLRKKELI